MVLAPVQPLSLRLEGKHRVFKRVKTMGPPPHLATIQNINHAETAGIMNL